jgi:predicted MFS family arabinose efflux permease
MGILVAGFLLMEVGYACFWPAVSSELSRGKSRKSLNRTLGVYNITWSTAVTVGFPVTGWIFDHNPDLPLFLGALLAATALILLWKLPQTNNGAPEPMTEIPQRPRDWRKHLISARVLLFGSFFSLGTASTFFPLLGAEIKMTALSIGMVIFFIRGVMTILFLSLVFTERWHYKFKLLLVSQAVALAGLGLFFTAGGPAFFSISLAAIGVGAGAAYGAGIYYSTFGHSDSGAKLGMHESILVCGTFAASFLGGPLAQKFNIRAPFALAALVMVGAIALAIFIMKRRQAEEA